MPAAQYDFTIEQGTTVAKVFTYKDDSNANIDLTGYTARMQARATIDASSPLIDLTTENGGITLGGAAGTVTINISATETAAYTFTTAVYDLELVSAGGVVTRLLKGTITLDKEVTRA